MVRRLDCASRENKNLIQKLHYLVLEYPFFVHYYNVSIHLMFYALRIELAVDYSYFYSEDHGILQYLYVSQCCRADMD